MAPSNCETAPFYDEVAEAPPQTQAFWIKASDGVRLRIGVERSGRRATLLILPGRTEYIEKYGRFMKGVTDMGISSAIIDWRGQGLSDRLIADSKLGHVKSFLDYQKDLAAMLELMRGFSLPEPWIMFAHSMGGTIGLRAMLQGLKVRHAVFAAPLWGLNMATFFRSAAKQALRALSKTTMNEKLPPGIARESYLLRQWFRGNVITNDRDMYKYLVRQLKTHSELALGGPTIGWTNQAIRETRLLAKSESPDTEATCFTGTKEKVVDFDSMTMRMARWRNGELRIIQGAKHGLVTERAAVVAQMYGKIDSLAPS